MIKVTLGVSSSIAAYKACDVARRFMERGCSVRVVMTANAAKLVSPVTFEALTGNPVAMDLFGERSASRIEHVELARWEDLFVVAPATANSIGKFAAGIADDFLTTHYLASTAPCLVAPAMNGRMWRSAAVRANLETLMQRGVAVSAPRKGMLACGEEDDGALQEPLAIVEEALALLKPRDLSGRKVLVTAGPTREYIDPVRFVSNPSTGKMGYAIAEEAARRGAEVVLVTGPAQLPEPPGAKVVRVETTLEMKEAVLAHFKRCDILFMAAAPSDFRPSERAGEKIPRRKGVLLAELLPTEDILKALAPGKKGRLVCAFAAETSSHLANAKRKLKEKGADAIALNDVSKPGSGFASDENEITLLFASGKTVRLGRGTKRSLAGKLVTAFLSGAGK